MPSAANSGQARLQRIAGQQRARCRSCRLRRTAARPRPPRSRACRRDRAGRRCINGHSRSAKPAKRWATSAAPPRSAARQPRSTPPANTGASSVVASDPSTGTKESITMMTRYSTVIASHTPGAPVNRRQPSVHHARPLPASTAAIGGGEERRSARVRPGWWRRGRRRRGWRQIGHGGRDRGGDRSPWYGNADAPGRRRAARSNRTASAPEDRCRRSPTSVVTRDSPSRCRAPGGPSPGCRRAGTTHPGAFRAHRRSPATPAGAPSSGFRSRTRLRARRRLRVPVAYRATRRASPGRDRGRAMRDRWR